jgi:glycosyltransferase involved in cell wall biosynthesis
VPEKGLHDLIDAFQRLDTDRHLVIAGDADHETGYSRQLKAQMAAVPQVVHTGYITGDPLNQVFSHAGLFVLPSYHEGLPIALLEAMSFGLPVLVSDIPANREVNLSKERYFRCGDVPDLAGKLAALMSRPLSDTDKQTLRRRIRNTYNWQTIAAQTLADPLNAMPWAASGLCRQPCLETGQKIHGGIYGKNHQGAGKPGPGRKNGRIRQKPGGHAAPVAA